MANIIEVGQVTNIPGKRRYVKDSGGLSTTFTQQGSQTDMAYLFDLYCSYNWNVTLEEDDANTWTVSANVPWDVRKGTEPGNEIPAVQWELTYETENKSVLDIDNPVVNLVKSVTKKAIQDALKEGKDEILNNRLKQLSVAGAITNDENSAAMFLYQHMKAGQKTAPIEVPVLIKSAVSSDRWSINWSQQNRGKIFSTSTLLGTEAIDQSLYYTISQFNDVYVNGSNDFYIPKVYGWKKGSPKTVVTSNNRRQITQQWTYGLWPILFFGEAL